jgi:hypothetical protein
VTTRKKLIAVLSAIGSFMALTLTLGTAPAHAITQICGNSGSGYCLNDWGGANKAGDAVKMYYGGYTNDNFEYIAVDACDGGNIIRSDCASAWGAEGNEMVGFSIWELKDANSSNECLATDSSANAILGACGNATGAGAANGVIMADQPSGGGTAGLIDRYWSHSRGFFSYLMSGGNPGVQAFFFDSEDATVWNGP